MASHFFEHADKGISMLVADRKRNLVNALISCGEQLLCFFYANPGKIIGKCDTGFFLEIMGQIVACNAQQLAYFIQIYALTYMFF